MPFASIVGHRQAVDLLRTAVRQERVPQSLLLSGPEGLGKRATALALAQAVNCPNRRDGDGCGRCPTCLRIARGQHADVVFLDTDGEASIKIQPLRERVLDAVGYRPFEASRRVFIIDPADALTTPAQDALLKTLEEPPSTTILVLISAFADTLLPTIQSRCRRLRFGPLTDGEVARVLVDRCAVEPAAARALAATAGGSVGAALASESTHVEADRAAAIGLLAAAGREPAAGRLRAAERLAKHGSKRRDREALGARLSVMTAILRDVAAAQAGAPGVTLEADLGALRSAFDLGRATAGFMAVAQAQAWLEHNAGPKIIADWVALTL